MTEEAEDERQDRCRHRRRFGRAEEVAGLVGYLCGEDTGFVTGATFDINGGVFMW
jgi:NAD(P)-dependent dehydrogenase (short-subunit alcohol dehydrogenase family)